VFSGRSDQPGQEAFVNRRLFTLLGGQIREHLHFAIFIRKQTEGSG
jgi:hypothetical protein